MDIKVKEQNDNLFKVEVSISKEDIEKEVKETLSYYQKNANIPGFRKGKVPLGIVEKSLGGREKLMEDAKKAVIAKAEDKVSENYRAITELEKEESEDGMVITYSFEAVPEIEIPKVDELVIDHKKTYFDKEKIIEDTLNKYREEYAILKPVDRDTVSSGDIVEVQIEEETGNKLTDRFEVSENSQSLIAKHSLGKKIDEEFEVEEDGEKRKIKITAILEKVLPELDDEFAKQVDESVESLEDLKKKLEESITSYIENLENNAINNEIMEKLIKDTKMKVSEKTLKRLTDSEMERIKKEKGEDFSKYLEEKKMTEEELWESLKEDLINYWKERLVIENIAQLFGLSVSTQEIVNTIISMYPYMAKDKKKLENNIKKDPSLYSEIADIILKNKIATKLRDKVKVNITEETKEESEENNKDNNAEEA
jgi:trigger factor